MTLQNRVSPFGVLEADAARGTLMGNRGCLVNARGDLVRDRRLSDVDVRLHRERTRGVQQAAMCADLPDGATISLGGRAWVVADGGLCAWTHGGYDERRPWPAGRVAVLTPPSTVAAMRAGSRPRLHTSARERGAG